MSSLYQTPSQVAAELTSRTKTGNWLKDTFTDWVSDGITMGEDGQIDRSGAAWWLQGLTPGAQTIAEGKQNLQDARLIDQAVQGSGLTPAEIKAVAGDTTLTASNVGGFITAAQRKIGDRITPQQQATIDYNKANLQGQQEARNDAREHQQWVQRNTIQQQREAIKERALTREANKEAALLGHQTKLIELEQLKQRDAYAMQKYEHELAYRKEQAREKRTSNLIQALAGLGAAFAI